MAGEVTPEAATPEILPTDTLYRGINPQYYQDGILTSGVFVLKKKHTIGQGPSVGIAKLIPVTDFRARIEAGWGVGELPASVPLDLGLRVHHLPDPKWGAYANAHAVITDYQKLSDSGKTSAERALLYALQKSILIPPTKST